MGGGRKKLGLLGGLGPMAGVYLAELVTDMTDALTDQEHIDMLLYSDPGVPDRTAFMLGESADSPVPGLLRGLKFLEEAGCTNIAMACVTAHCYESELKDALKSAKLLSILDLTAAKLSALGIGRAGLTATTGTTRTKIFQRALEAKGIECVLPHEEDQRIVMGEIYEVVKAGKRAGGEVLAGVARRLAGAGAQCIILGCTELSIIKRDAGREGGSALEAPGVPKIVDTLDVLAEAAVIASGAKLKRCGG
jgi:aspartate racemase